MSSSPRLSNPENSNQQLQLPPLPPPLPPPPPPPPSSATMEAWLDDACIAEADQLVKTITASKAKGAHPELIATIVSRYAARWLPELGGADAAAAAAAASVPTTANAASPSSPSSSNSSPSLENASSMAAYMKKRFFVETLAGALFAAGATPPSLAPSSPPCNFLLRLLRVGTMVGADPSRLAELEARAARQLDQASLRELMIPAFSHTCGTLLDIGLALRLVRRFAALDETVKSGAAIVKVAKLVDSYLAEAAVDANLGIQEFEALASALPPHARSNDDGLYRAVDTYLKAHPATSKMDRKALFRLMDTRKLSPEASIHAARNERLPVRAAIQVLFAEQSRVNRGLNAAAAAAAAVNNDWTAGSFSGSRSPGSAGHHSAVDLSARCPSRRETVAAATQQQFQQQQQEIRKLREDVARVQVQCHSLQSQLDRMLVEKNNKVKKKSSSSSGYYSRWKSLLLFRPNVDTVDRRSRVVEDEDEAGTGTLSRTTPTARTGAADGKGRKRLVQSEVAKSMSTPPKWRYSTS